MRSCWLVISVALASGCRDAEQTQLEKLKDEACSCKTARCGEEVLERVPQPATTPKPRARAIVKQMIACLAKLNEAARPDAEPDAPVGTGGSAERGSGDLP